MAQPPRKPDFEAVLQRHFNEERGGNEIDLDDYETADELELLADTSTAEDSDGEISHVDSNSDMAGESDLEDERSVEPEPELDQFGLPVPAAEDLINTKRDDSIFEQDKSAYYRILQTHRPIRDYPPSESDHLDPPVRSLPSWTTVNTEVSQIERADEEEYSIQEFSSDEFLSQSELELDAGGESFDLPTSDMRPMSSPTSASRHELILALAERAGGMVPNTSGSPPKFVPPSHDRTASKCPRIGSEAFPLSVSSLKHASHASITESSSKRLRSNEGTAISTSTADSSPLKRSSHITPFPGIGLLGRLGRSRATDAVLSEVAKNFRDTTINEAKDTETIRQYLEENPDLQQNFQPYISINEIIVNQIITTGSTTLASINITQDPETVAVPEKTLLGSVQMPFQREFAEQMPDSVSSDPPQLWCVCRRPDDGSRMVTCNIPTCIIKRFHWKCLSHSEKEKTWAPWNRTRKFICDGCYVPGRGDKGAKVIAQINTNEEVYCVCRAPDNGKRMLDCHNPHCLGKRFHWTCLTKLEQRRSYPSYTTALWYCNACYPTRPTKKSVIADKKKLRECGSSVDTAAEAVVETAQAPPDDDARKLISDVPKAICVCRTREGNSEIVTCDNKNCPIKKFHLKCLEKKEKQRHYRAAARPFSCNACYYLPRKSQTSQHNETDAGEAEESQFTQSLSWGGSLKGNRESEIVVDGYTKERVMERAISMLSTPAIKEIPHHPYGIGTDILGTLFPREPRASSTGYESMDIDDSSCMQPSRDTTPDQ